MSHDYSEYAKPQSEDALARLSRLADQQLEAQRDLATAEADVKRAKKALADVAEVAIPELMEELGIEDFTTTSGVKISVKEKVRASIIAAQKAAAFRWLRENGHEALIKRKIEVQFGMGEDAQAQEALAALGDLPVKDDSSVHAQTLAKFVRELLAEGKDVPEEMFSVHKQRVSNIKI
jgi:hypothetical protein